MNEWIPSILLPSCLTVWNIYLISDYQTTIVHHDLQNHPLQCLSHCTSESEVLRQSHTCFSLWVCPWMRQHKPSTVLFHNLQLQQSYRKLPFSSRQFSCYHVPVMMLTIMMRMGQLHITLTRYSLFTSHCTKNCSCISSFNYHNESKGATIMNPFLQMNIRLSKIMQDERVHTAEFGYELRAA